MRKGKDLGNKKNAISLNRAIDMFSDQSMMEQLFLNMDRSMHYLHNNGFFIESFNPNDISIINGDLRFVKFNKISPFPLDVPKAAVIKSDIFLDAYLHICLYGSFFTLNDAYLREHFDEFTFCLPEDLVPYYRGVVTRGASVYLEDYVNEAYRKKIAELEGEVGGTSKVGSKMFVKSNGHAILDSKANKLNNNIYGDIISKNDRFDWGKASFVGLLSISCLVVFILVVCFIVLVF